MKVGIYSNNAQVNTTLVSMCASCGCKVQKILKYDKSQFKGSDMIIIDLDNCEDSNHFLEEDIQSMPEIVFIGISKDLDIIDNYRAIMNVERKPFQTKIFKHYKDLVLKRLETTIVITKEEDRTYDEFGLNLAATFSNSNIAIEDRLSVLKNAIQEKSNYDSEEVFLKKIGLGDIEYQEVKKIPLEPLDIREEINKDAIVKYRIRKLKMMNLSNKDIDNKINEFINANINVSLNRPKISSNEQDILTRLRKQGQRNNRFKEKKQELENQKLAETKASEVHIETPPPKNINVSVEPEKVETTLDISEPPKKPILEKPILNNDNGSLKKPTFKKPIISIDNGVKSEEIKPDTESDKSELEIETTEVISPVSEPPKKPMFARPQLSIDNNKTIDTSTEVKKEPIREEAVDPLIKFRREKEERRKQLEERKESSIVNKDDKTNTLNINEDKIIKDNSEDAFGVSLVDKMQEQLGYINTHKKPKRESAYDIANKKSKPPR